MSTPARKNTVVEQYIQLSPHSQAHFKRAHRSIPAGATRSLNSWSPYPIYLKKGKGSIVWDIDGREYVDFLNNYTALMLGHNHSQVKAAVTEQLEDGITFAFATELEATLAEILIMRVPSIEKIRFTGSGTEAAMFALRLARTFTGRMKIAKMEGGYHGTYDGVSISVRPKLEDAGPVTRPIALPDANGLPSHVVEDVLVLPFNHMDETKALIEEYADQLAAIIIEPVLGVGGMIVPTSGYLALIRELCTQYGILLIFDEVITLRLASGGAQELFGVIPDMTIMGKVIGGGLPVGAIGGSADVMALLEPQGGHDVYDARGGGPRLYQGGTFTGNPLMLAAGIATMRELTSNVYVRLNVLGDQLRARLAELFEDMDVPVSVTGVGSLFNVHLTQSPVYSFRDTRRTHATLQQEFFLGLLNEGIIIAPRGMGCLSEPMTEVHVEQFLEATRRVLLNIL